MSSIREQKAELRAEVLEKRMELKPSDWRKKSDQIISRILQLKSVKEADCIHTYLSMNSRKEVCTDSLIEALFEMGKRVVVPISNFKDLSLSHVYIEPGTQFKENKWGVREPLDAKVAPVDILDTVIIPMAAGDMQGNRLGYGKGFYDRFLSGTSAKKVGLVFDDFLLAQIPCEEFDVKLDCIISEEREIFA